MHKIVFILEDYTDREAEDLADELRNTYSKTKTMDEVILYYGVPKSDEDYRYLQMMRESMEYDNS